MHALNCAKWCVHLEEMQDWSRKISGKSCRHQTMRMVITTPCLYIQPCKWHLPCSKVLPKLTAWEVILRFTSVLKHCLWRFSLAIYCYNYVYQALTHTLEHHMVSWILWGWKCLHLTGPLSGFFWEVRNSTSTVSDGLTECSESSGFMDQKAHHVFIIDFYLHLNWRLDT